MKEGKASRSAETIAVYRATESKRPESERVVYDPFAKNFLRTTYRLIGKSRFLADIAVWYGAERRFPGCFGSIVARVRHIDEYLRSCIDDGIRQLVILGAGYDTRAYRFDELKGKAKVSEVDHPSTQKVKLGKLKKIFSTVPEHVIYVSIDFNREKLDKRLFESGYDPELKTLFIWEGVTMYITAEAVDETLAFVAENSGEGSSITFDYILPSVVDGTCQLEGAKRWRRNVRMMGEPFTFGIEEGAIEGFLSERGFHQVENITGDSLKSTYYKEANQNRKMQRFHGHVHATVKPR